MKFYFAPLFLLGFRAASEKAPQLFANEHSSPKTYAFINHLTPTAPDSVQLFKKNSPLKYTSPFWRSKELNGPRIQSLCQNVPADNFWNRSIRSIQNSKEVVTLLMASSAFFAGLSIFLTLKVMKQAGTIEEHLNILHPNNVRSF